MFRIALVAVALVACGARAVHPSWPDAPIELRDDSDREAAIDHLWIMPAGIERDRARAAIAAATAARIGDAITDERVLDAAALLDQLTWMWQSDPDAIGRGLAIHVELIKRLRAMFAKAGALEPATQTLILLSELEPARRAAYLAELDEILAFADDLHVTEHGEMAKRAQPIALLGPTALALPLPWLVDRYVTLLVERQAAVAEVLDKAGAASVATIRAHRDVVSSAHRIANILARAGRLLEIRGKISAIKGIGYDRELLAHADAVVDQPSADAYGELAATLRLDEHAADPAAALAVAVAGLARYPNDPNLQASAGTDARSLGRLDQAITFYESSLRGADEVDSTIALRLGKLYGERIARLASSGRPGAANDAWHDVIKFTASAAKSHPNVVWQQAAAIAESALGKGLASQGLVEDGHTALTRSLERAPSIDAFETLSTIDVQVDRFGDARAWAQRGIELLGEGTGDRYRRAKLERIAGDAMRRAGKSREAALHYLESLRTWGTLGDDRELPKTIAAERKLDTGRAAWWLGDDTRSIDLVMRAIDADPTTPSISAGAVAFLIEAHRYRDALDAFHRGLGEPGGSELYKVYTSLWILGEAKRLGEPRDRLAGDYLASRRGTLWYEQLAQVASGHLTLDALRAAATTGPRKGELAFYGAVLGFDPRAATPDGRRKLLREAVDARVIFDAEYDLARMYLAEP
jgi:tetratricopeptide (TPR) repeat protein